METVASWVSAAITKRQAEQVVGAQPRRLMPFRHDLLGVRYRKTPYREVLGKCAVTWPAGGRAMLDTVRVVAGRSQATADGAFGVGYDNFQTGEIPLAPHAPPAYDVIGKWPSGGFHQRVGHILLEFL